MDAQLDRAAQDVRQLHRCIDDLTSLLALPAVWSDCQPSEIARTTLDTLIAMLGLDFMYVRLSAADDGPGTEMVHLAQPLQWQGEPREIGATLERSLGDDISKWPASAQVRIADADLCVAAARLGLHGDIGIIVAGSQRSGFPGQTDRVVLNVAANQAAVALQEVRRLQEPKQFARERGEPASQRTRELTAGNEQLKTEAMEHWQAEASPGEDAHNSRLIEDGIPGPFAIFRPGGEVELVNRKLLEYFGRTRESLKRWVMSDDFHPEDLSRVIGHFTQSISSGDPFEFEVRARRFDGTYRWFQSRGFPLRDADGRIARWYNLLIDIEERKRAEEAVLRSQSRLAAAERDLRLAIDTIPVFVAAYEPDGTRSFVNRSWQDYMGITAEEATGADAQIFPHFHPADIEPNDRAWRASRQSGEPLSIEVRVRRADGQYRWHTSRRVPLRDEAGNIVRWYSVGIDIEDQKVAEEALRRSEARLAEAERELRLTLDSIPVITWRGAANGYVQQLNKRWFEYTGTTPEQVRGRRWKDSVHPEDLEELVDTGIKYVASGIPVDSEARLRRFDGTYRWFLFRPAPAHDETGKISGWYGVILDVEDRKRAEQALAASGRNLRLIIDTIPALAWSARTDGSAEFLSQHFLDYVGLSLEQARDWGWSAAVHPDDLSGLVGVWRTILASGHAGEAEARLRRADGEYRWFLFRTNPLHDEQGNIVKWYGINTDIEDRKRAEEQLRRNETFLAQAQRLTLTGSLWWKVSTGETIWSDENFRLLQYPRTIKPSIELKMNRVHPEDLSLVRETFARSANEGANMDFEHRLLMPDGSVKHVHIVLQNAGLEPGKPEFVGAVTDITDRKQAEERLRRSETLLADGERLSATGTLSWRVDTNEIRLSEEFLRIFELDRSAALTLERCLARVHPEDLALVAEKMDEIRAGRDNREYEVRLRMADDRVKHVRVMGRAIRHRDGRLECLGAVQDVTQRRLAEMALDKVRSELTHLTRVMSLSALTASIAHEVNQPLAGILTNASTCLRMLAADPPNVEGARETVRRAIRDGNRAADVISRLRALFGKKAASTETVDLNEATQEVLSLLASDLWRNRVILRAELDNDHPLLVTGDRVQLQQVILNLVRNASDAMSDINDRPRHLLIRAESEQERAARLVVKDSGVGLDPQAVDRLFDAFFTTKSDGMGIGLSVSRSIIESHGGKIWAEANDGPGATFAFSIPRMVG